MKQDDELDQINGKYFLKMGFIGSTGVNSNISSDDVDPLNFSVLAHEILGHGYQYLVAEPKALISGSYLSSVQVELDPTLISAMAIQEHDALNPDDQYVGKLEDSHNYTSQLIPTSQGSTQNPAANAAFAKAWDDIIVNKNFTLANYNTLVGNFLTGSQYNG